MVVRTYIIQFMKGRKYGEVIAAEKYLPNLTVEQFGLDSFVMRDNPRARRYRTGAGRAGARSGNN